MATQQQLARRVHPAGLGPCGLLSARRAAASPLPRLLAATTISRRPQQQLRVAAAAAAGAGAASSQPWSSRSTQQQQQQQQQTAEATAAEATACAGGGGAWAAAAPLPFAALSRVLLNANNSAMFRSALGPRRQAPASGPLGLLLFLLTLVAASLAAIRSALVRRGKGCRTCRGFGLQRCRLCLGSGRVDWAAKLKHFDVCPLCMNRRFIVCSECGGHYHRSMFSHRRRQAGGSFEPTASFDELGGAIAAMVGGGGGGAVAGSAVSFGRGGGDGGGPIVLTLAGAGAGAAPTLPSNLSD